VRTTRLGDVRLAVKPDRRPVAEAPRATVHNGKPNAISAAIPPTDIGRKRVPVARAPGLPVLDGCALSRRT
jgi:hypothetical protein